MIMVFDWLLDRHLLCMELYYHCTLSVQLLVFGNNCGCTYKVVGYWLTKQQMFLVVNSHSRDLTVDWVRMRRAHCS